MRGHSRGAVRARYFARKSAVALYLAGANDDEIQQTSGIGAKQAYRLIRERCLQVHPDGQPYGWRALVPYHRIKPYECHRPIRVSHFGTGAAGAFTAVLDRHTLLYGASSSTSLLRQEEATGAVARIVGDCCPTYSTRIEAAKNTDIVYIALGGKTMTSSPQAPFSARVWGSSGRST